MLVKLNKAGKTIITATHDPAIVPMITDRVCVLGEDHRLAGGLMVPLIQLPDINLVCSRIGCSCNVQPLTFLAPGEVAAEDPVAPGADIKGYGHIL